MPDYEAFAAEIDKLIDYAEAFFVTHRDDLTDPPDCSPADIMHRVRRLLPGFRTAVLARGAELEPAPSED